MYKRTVIKDIKIAREIYPVVFIMGPKGVGKTSFAIDIAKNFYSFDDVHTYLSAKNDPYDFVSNLKTPCMIDEAQKIPEILTFIEKEIEKNREIGIKYILTSSVDMLKNNLLKNSLQNAAFLKFFPFTLKEICSKENENPVDDLFNKRFLDSEYSYIPRNEIIEHILKGGFPEVLKIKKNIYRFLWYANYTNIAILKNAIETFELRNYDKFLHLLTILAKSSADVINKSEIYQSAGIDNKTLDTYLKFLEDSFHITLLKSFKPLPEDKKIVKSPKLFFQDTGLLCYLLGIKSADELAKSPYVENIFMTFIFSEIIKHINTSDSLTNIFFTGPF
jgi:predicted AAA+ superfamily ATPase